MKLSDRLVKLSCATRPRRIWFLAPPVLLLLLLAGRGWADNAVRLVRMDPSGEVGTRTNFTFFFSADVVPKNRVGVLGTTDKVRFRPAVPGKIRWDRGSRLRYYPETELRPSTAYTVEFAADLPYEMKKPLTGNRQLSFTTERFRVVEGELDFIYNPQRKQGLICQARLNFNYPVSTDELQRNLSLRFTDNGQPVRFSTRLQSGGRTAVVTTDLLVRGAAARRVELRLKQGFLCLGGGIGLKADYVLTQVFRERRALSIEGVDAEAGEGGNRVEIRCSEPVDPDAVENFISVTPAVKFRLGVDGEVVTLTGESFKPGETYRIKVKKGLPALNGMPLAGDFTEDATFPDLEPSVGFNSPGRYLSSRGHLNLGVETVNISQVEVEIAKIYANNIVPYLSEIEYEGRCYSYDLARFGRIEERRAIQVNKIENEVATTPVNLREFLAGKKRGIFQVSVCDPENRWLEASKVVIVTDLGILAKFGQDELIVWVNSLETLAPVAGARVSLYSYNNQELLTGETDARGVVRFAGQSRQLEEYRSYVIIAEHGEDLSFVGLDDGLIDLTDFPVEGRRQLVEGYEAYLYLDRGVFRPGDAANLVAVVRGPEAAAPPEFPVRLELIGPDGLVFREYNDSTRQAGVCEFRLEIPEYARTGRYRAMLYVAKQPIGEASFNVEEFMPDRIKVETLPDKERYTKGESATVLVRGINLFGPPAAGRRVELTVSLEPMPFSPANYRSYSFGDPTLRFQAVEEPVGQGTLDGTGQAKLAYNFPANLNPPGMIRAVFGATVTEDGGRAVSSYKAVEYHPYQAYIGIRPGGDYYAKVGEAYPVNLVLVDTAGKPLTGAAIEVEIYSVTWNSIYRRDSGGRYTYHSVRQEDRIGRDAVRLATGEGVYTYRPGSWGCYKLVFTDPRTGARGVYEFYATGWGYSPWAMDRPGRVELDLDKKLYKPGESAKVQIKAPFSGMALVTVEREKVHEIYTVELKENTGMISIPIKEEYKPNVYISVHLIRSIKNLDKRAPTRAFGTIPLAVDASRNQLALSIDCPGETRPNGDLTVQIAAAGAGGETYLTLAAVDEGICQLTEFTAPDPWAFFYGKRALSLKTYDLYGMLLPELAAAGTPGSPGGDGVDEEGVRRQNLNPVAVRRVKPVSLWSGLVKLDAAGKARIKLSVPQFNGTLRLMAVASSGADFGMAVKPVIIRDPIVMTSTFPRFLAPGDRAVIPVVVYNGTGKEGDFQVKLAASGPVKIDGYDFKEITLAAGQEKMVNYAVIAQPSAGACHFTLTAQGNGALSRESVELAVRPPQPATGKFLAGAITAATPQELDLKADWLGGTGRYTLTMAPLPALKFAGGLQYLLGYPYGCLEQTTSKLFPLLYFEDLARAAQPDLIVNGRAEKYVYQGMDKICSMQLRSGGFSFWPGTDYSNDWGSVYAAHFLVEARKAGYTVPDRVYGRMLDFLSKLGRRGIEGSWPLQLRVYALYVLSLAEAPQLSSMAYLKGQWLDDLYPDSRAQLAAAYYYAGDKKTARELMPAAFAASALKREKGGNFNSAIRSDAIILGVLADTDPSHPAVVKLVERLQGAARSGRWYTTQENAYAFMALGKLFRRKEGASYTGEVLVNGERLAVFDSKEAKRISDPRLGGGRVTIKISGTGECYYYAESTGVSLAPDAPGDKGLTVRREILDRTGRAVDRNHIRQGDLLVVKLTVKTDQDNMDHVVIADLLPAGLEIENPRLASSAKLTWLSGEIVAPQYMDIRDDRLLLFASFGDAGTRVFYYAVRAVSCGAFTLPPVKAECMYEPEVWSISGAGSIAVEK